MCLCVCVLICLVVTYLLQQLPSLSFSALDSCWNKQTKCEFVGVGLLYVCVFVIVVSVRVCVKVTRVRDKSWWKFHQAQKKNRNTETCTSECIAAHDNSYNNNNIDGLNNNNKTQLLIIRNKYKKKRTNTKT